MLMVHTGLSPNRPDAIPSSDFDDLWIDRLSQHEALNDSPSFRQSLVKAELLAAQIQAHYSVTLESCREAIKTGVTFASALSNFAICVNVDQLPKQTHSIFDIPTPQSGLDCDPSKGFQQVHQLLLHVAKYTADLTSQFKEPERLVLEAQKQLDQLLDLRTSFHRAADQLESTTVRSCSAHTGRSHTDPTVTDTQVTELRQIYRNTAAAYLAGLQAAIVSIPITTYLRSSSAVLSSVQWFIARLCALSDDSSSPPSGLQSAVVLKEFLTHLTHWAEARFRMTNARDQYKQPVADHKQDLSPVDSVQMEGYLLKRASKRTWRTWARRWFRLSSNQLTYCKRVPCVTGSDLQAVTDLTVVDLKRHLTNPEVYCVSPANGMTSNVTTQSTASSDVYPELVSRLISQSIPKWKVMESDLRLCTAREGTAVPDRRFTFELISHGNRIHVLQAESFDQRERWIVALRSGLMHLQHSKNFNSSNHFDTSSTNPLDSAHMHSSSRTFNTSLSVSPTGQQTHSPSLNQVTNVPGSQQAIPEYDHLCNQGGVVLWREPYGSANRLCADCSIDGTSWASINLGVTLCTQCAAVHRGLGVHVSKIRSLTLDNWEPELLHLMLNLGNELVNSIYEYKWPTLAQKFPRPTLASSSEQRRTWIRAKWAKCLFVRFPLLDSNKETNGVTIEWIRSIYDRWSELRKLVRISSSQRDRTAGSSSSSADTTTVIQSPPAKRHMNNSRRTKRRLQIISDLSDVFGRLQGQSLSSGASTSRRATLLRTQEEDIAASHLLYAGARLGCPPLMLAALAAGAHPDGDQHQSSRILAYPPLIAAVRSASLAACECLLLNGADVDVADELGRTALHHACSLRKVHLVCLLLRRRADQRRADQKGLLPLDIAVELADADIVTLLRLQRLRDDDRDSDYTVADDTVTDVFRDYTSRAYMLDSDSDASDHTVVELRHATSSPTVNVQQVSVGITPMHVKGSSTVIPQKPGVLPAHLPKLSSHRVTADRRRRRILSPVRSCISSDDVPMCPSNSDTSKLIVRVTSTEKI